MKNEIDFLGYTIGQQGLAMMKNKVEAILEWPIPRTVKHVRSFLGLAGFYREFIKMFSDTVVPLSDLTKKDLQFHWGHEQQIAFETLKKQITSQPTLILPRENVPFVIQTDASGFAVGAALMQNIGNGLQPIAFLSHKLNDAQTRYTTHEQELLAVIHALKEWRHYLSGTTFTVQTDHQSLIWLQSQQHLTKRQRRWSDEIQKFDIKIEYKPGTENIVADALSRRHDHESTTTPMNTLNQLNIHPSEEEKESSSNHLSTNLNIEIQQGYQLDIELKMILENLNRKGMDENNQKKEIEENNENSETRKREHRNNEYTLNQQGLIMKENRIVIPAIESIRTMIMTSCHDDKTAGHPGITKTIDLLSRDFYWKNMNRHIKEYVNSCIQCQRNKPSNQTPIGLLQPIPAPEQRWHTVTMDLITQLPKTKLGNDAIVVFVDKFSKLAHYVPTTTEISAPRLATLFIDNIVRLHGLPSNIISDRDPRFTSLFWKSLWKQLGTQLSMSTAFHPQSDGQTERQNRTLEQSLRAYTDYKQDDWDLHLSILELAHNNLKHASTGYSPYFLNTGQHPRLPVHQTLGKEIMINEPAETLIQNLYDTLEQAHFNLNRAQLNQAKYANEHRREIEPWKVGQQVMLSTGNLKTPGRAPKLCSYWIGPFSIKRVLSCIVYELELPANMKIHPVFHVSHLKLANESTSFPSRPVNDNRPPAELLDDTKEEVFEVERILNKRIVRNRKQYLVKWKGYPDWETTWEPESAFKQHRDSIEQFELEEKQKNQIDLRPTSHRQNNSSN